MPEITRGKHGKFKPGLSANPAGKPLGARSRATLAAATLLDGEANALTRKAVEMAMAGDAIAMRLCLERILPPRKDRPVAFGMPPLATADDAAKGISAILTAVAGGELTPAEGTALAALVAGFARTLETAELEKRIEMLENSRGQNDGENEFEE